MLLHTNIVQYKHIFVSLSLLPYLLLLSFLMSIYLTASGLSCGTQDLLLRPTGFTLIVACGSVVLVRAQLPHGMWDLSSLTKDRTYIPWIGRWVLSQGSFYFCFCGGVEPKRYSCIPYDPAFPLLGYIFKGNEISLPKRSAPLHSLQHGLPKYPSVDK